MSQQTSQQADVKKIFSHLQVTKFAWQSWQSSARAPLICSIRSHNRGRRPKARGPRSPIEKDKCAIFRKNCATLNVINARGYKQIYVQRGSVGYDQDSYNYLISSMPEYIIVFIIKNAEKGAKTLRSVAAFLSKDKWINETAPKWTYKHKVWERSSNYGLWNVVLVWFFLKIVVIFFRLKLYDLTVMVAGVQMK